MLMLILSCTTNKSSRISVSQMDVLWSCNCGNEIKDLPWLEKSEARFGNLCSLTNDLSIMLPCIVRSETQRVKLLVLINYKSEFGNINFVESCDRESCSAECLCMVLLVTYMGTPLGCLNAYGFIKSSQMMNQICVNVKALVSFINYASVFFNEVYGIGISNTNLVSCVSCVRNTMRMVCVVWLMKYQIIDLNHDFTISSLLSRNMWMATFWSTLRDNIWRHNLRNIPWK